jgi:cyclophilin family peptidyl-prolyl cis-trans isomerase
MGYQYDDTLTSRKPTKGTLAMANAGPNTNGSQFFVNLVDNDFLTGKHTVFGKVVKGMDVVESIGAVAVGEAARPVESVTIRKVRAWKAD